MSPTVFRYKNYRFYFFSREEERMHVHVYCTDGEAKFWRGTGVRSCDATPEIAGFPKHDNLLEAASGLPELDSGSQGLSAQFGHC